MQAATVSQRIRTSHTWSHSGQTNVAIKRKQTNHANAMAVTNADDSERFQVRNAPGQVIERVRMAKGNMDRSDGEMETTRTLEDYQFPNTVRRAVLGSSVRFSEASLPKSLHQFREECEERLKNTLLRSVASNKSLVVKQPKILSKVIPRFESKLGSERPFLFWTTRRSQYQYGEATGLN